MYQLNFSSKAKKFIVKRTPKEQIRLIDTFDPLLLNYFVFVT